MSNSIVFSGNTSSYVTVPYSASLAPGLSDFTVEWWQYMTVNRTYPRVFSLGVAQFSVSLEAVGSERRFYYWRNGTPLNYFLISPFNTWINYAISRVSGTTRIFENGVLKLTIPDNVSYINPSNSNLTIGNQPSLSDNNASYGGSIYGFNYLIGTGNYTTNYTVPTIYPSVTSNTILLLSYNDYYYSQGTVTATGVSSGVPAPGITVLCFLEGTKILTDQSYIEVEKLEKGTLVKTLNHGYLPVNQIKSKKIKQSDMKLIDKLYKIKCGENEAVLTGGHSLLVDHLTQEQYEKMSPYTNGIVYMTESKMRLYTCFHDTATPYEEGEYTIWHFSLDNDIVDESDKNIDKKELNYGVYANDILVESCSKMHMEEF
jgi:hypothetical protein